MENAENLKEAVREKYGQLAREGGSCCGPASCCGPDKGNGAGKVETAFVDFSEDYGAKEGYVKEADLGLGCGIPTDAADLKPGQVVLDLGSGAGNDVFVARGLVGESGKVIGVDMTPDMIKKARGNAAKLGFANVDFRLGEIEALPVEGSSIDRIISNCVLNLVPDKRAAFAEMFRVLKPQGSFGVSDIVIDGDFPEPLKQAAELYVGCVSGAIRKDAYLDTLRAAGFRDVEVVKEKEIRLPGDLLAAYLDDSQREALNRSGMRILSITVKGVKPSGKNAATPASCCTPLAAAGDGPCCNPL